MLPLQAERTERERRNIPRIRRASAWILQRSVRNQGAHLKSSGFLSSGPSDSERNPPARLEKKPNRMLLRAVQRRNPASCTTATLPVPEQREEHTSKAIKGLAIYAISNFPKCTNTRQEKQTIALQVHRKKLRASLPNM